MSKAIRKKSTDDLKKMVISNETDIEVSHQNMLYITKHSLIRDTGSVCSIVHLYLVKNQIAETLGTIR